MRDTQAHVNQGGEEEDRSTRVPVVAAITATSGIGKDRPTRKDGLKGTSNFMVGTMYFLETKNVFPVRHTPQKIQFTLTSPLFVLLSARQQQCLAIPRSDSERVIEEMEGEWDRVKPTALPSQGQSSGTLLPPRSCQLRKPQPSWASIEVWPRSR